MQPFTPPDLPLPSLDWSRFVPFLGPAHEALVRFDALLENVPNAALLLSPLAMQEAELSSRIEGTQATLDEVLRFQAEGKAPAEKRDDIQEVINYRIATETAFERLGALPLSGRLLLEAHEILMSGVRGKNKAPGQFRSGTVHIGAPGAPIEQARYIPPEAQKIPELFANLERYIHSEERNVLAQMAIVHAQFELIHPFWDGNGRIGRLLMPLFLYSKKIIAAPCFYISEYLEANRGEYYDRLNNISAHNDWEQWIEFWLRAVTAQSRRNAERAQSIIDLKEKMLLKIQEITHSQYTPQITNFIFSDPWFTGVQFRDVAAVPRPSAIRLLNLLEKSGIIVKVSPGKGGRTSLYCFPELSEILE